MTNFTPAGFGRRAAPLPDVGPVTLTADDLGRLDAWEEAQRRARRGETAATDETVTRDPADADRARATALPSGGCGSGTWGPEVPRCRDPIMQEFPMTGDAHPDTPAELARRRAYANPGVRW